MAFLKHSILAIKKRKRENRGQPSLKMEEEKKNDHKSFSLMQAVASFYLLLRADIVSKIHTAQI